MRCVIFFCILCNKPVYNACLSLSSMHQAFRSAYLLAGHSVSVEAGAEALRPVNTGISRVLEGAKGLGGLGENFSVTGRPLLYP